MKRENISCRPGTTDAMERLAAENEALRVERDEALSRCARAIEVLDIVKRHGIDSLKTTVNGIETTRDFVDVVLAETPAQSLAHIKAQGAREALHLAMQTPGFSDTVVRVNALQAVIADMEK